VSRRRLAHVAAPALFLLGVTAAVLLVRAGLEGGNHAQTTTLGRPAHSSTATGTAAGATSTGTTAARYYTVQKGDTLGAIAAREHTSVATLESLNPGVNPTALQVGERIRVR
jgi:LysM repeat protein